MSSWIRGVVCSTASLALAVGLLAQDKPAAPKPAVKKPVGGILHPEMKVADDAGTYAAPKTTLGEKPAEPWTATTLEAAVDKKPLASRVKTVKGEIIDLSCYLQLGKHGDKHKPCGTKCLKANQPIGLLAEDGTVYLLMEEEHHPRRDGQTNLREKAIENIATIVEVSGTATLQNGYKALYVQGFVSK